MASVTKIKRANPLNSRASPRKRNYTITGRMLIGEARRFLGVPYLWGGISPLGIDCSGLVQTICGRLGLDIPRDTKDQIRVGREIDRNMITTGDLLFFDRHVAIAIDRHKLIHASRLGGGVRINSLRSTDPDYRQDLDNDFKAARRIV